MQVAHGYAPNTDWKVGAGPEKGWEAAAKAIADVINREHTKASIAYEKKIENALKFESNSAFDAGHSEGVREERNRSI